MGMSPRYKEIEKLGMGQERDRERGREREGGGEGERDRERGEEDEEGIKTGRVKRVFKVMADTIERYIISDRKTLRLRVGKWGEQVEAKSTQIRRGEMVVQRSYDHNEQFYQYKITLDL